MGETLSALREQGKAIMVMMGIAILAVLAMIVLGEFINVVSNMTNLGNATVSGSTNVTVQALINLFIVSFGLVGSFASITMLVIIVKVIIGVVKGLKS